MVSDFYLDFSVHKTRLRNYFIFHRLPSGSLKSTKWFETGVKISLIFYGTHTPIYFCLLNQTIGELMIKAHTNSV